MSNYGTSLKDKLQHLQDRAARIVTECDCTNSLLHKLGWLNVQQSIDFDTAVIVRKNFKQHSAFIPF